MEARVSSTPLARSVGAQPALDADGFLIDTLDWSPELAKSFALGDGIDSLEAIHWKVIHLVRDRYFSLGALPVMRLVCRAAGLDPRQAHHVFSSCRSLWRIAGLPKPDDEVSAYMN